MLCLCLFDVSERKRRIGIWNAANFFYSGKKYFGGKENKRSCWEEGVKSCNNKWDWMLLLMALYFLLNISFKYV